MKRITMPNLPFLARESSTDRVEFWMSKKLMGESVSFVGLPLKPRNVPSLFRMKYLVCGEARRCKRADRQTDGRTAREEKKHEKVVRWTR
jgi:hypothetical protein